MCGPGKSSVSSMFDERLMIKDVLGPILREIVLRIFASTVMCYIFKPIFTCFG